MTPLSLVVTICPQETRHSRAIDPMGLVRMSNTAPSIATPSLGEDPQDSEGPVDPSDALDLDEQWSAETKSTPEAGPYEVAAMPRTRGKQKGPRKQDIHIRLDADIIEHFKRDGLGWQTRINDRLRKVVEVERASAERKPPA